MRKTIALSAAVLMGGLAFPVAPTVLADDAPTASTAEAVATTNMAHVANVAYPERAGYSTAGRQGGTDLEIVTLEGPDGPADIAVSGSYRNGIQLVDVTNPEHPSILHTYDCGVAQGDVQIFTRGDRTYAAYGADDIASEALGGSDCYQEGLALYGQTLPLDAAPGDVEALNADGMYGTFIIDITDPWAEANGENSVRTVGWARQSTGSHNTTVDPSGRFIYNSNQDLVADVPGEGRDLYQVEIFEIGDPDESGNFDVQRQAPFGISTGAGPHDITFNADGTRAYVAAVTHTMVIDTTDLANPVGLGEVIDPAISIHHQSDPVTLTDPITGLDRTFLVVSDELAGVIEGLAVCPGGMLHIYEITGDLEQAPVKVGAFGIAQLTPATQDHLRCTAHVFRIYDNGLATIAWYGAGVRVLDLNGLVGVSVGTELTGSAPVGIQEVGSIYLPQTDDQVGSQTWAAKMHTPRIDPETGAGFIFANDLDRGFDVYRFDGVSESVLPSGNWMSPTEALAAAADTIAARDAGASFVSYCLLLRKDAS